MDGAKSAMDGAKSAMDGAKSASAQGRALARPTAEVISKIAQRPEGLSSGAGRFSLVFAPFKK